MLDFTHLGRVLILGMTSKDREWADGAEVAVIVICLLWTLAVYNVYPPHVRHVNLDLRKLNLTENILSILHLTQDYTRRNP